MTTTDTTAPVMTLSLALGLADAGLYSWEQSVVDDLRTMADSSSGAEIIAAVAAILPGTDIAGLKAHPYASATGVYRSLVMMAVRLIERQQETITVLAAAVRDAQDGQS